MTNDRSILSIKDHGHIHIKLKEQMESRNISRNYLARAIHSRFEVVDRWYNDQVEKIDADILARICFVLDCRVEDILEYVQE